MKEHQINSPIHEFHPRIVNLSDTQFGPDELDILNKGLKYVPRQNLNCMAILSTAIDSELAQVKIEIPLKIQKTFKKSNKPEHEFS